MKLQTLKTNLLENRLPDSFMIFVCPENFFIADQYIEMICNKSGKEKRLIESIFEQQSALSLVFDFTDYVNVLKTETFSEFIEDYSELTDTIIVCNKVDKKIAELVKDYIIEVPKVEKHHLAEYILQRCPELDSLEVDWLLQATNQDIYKINNELDKLLVFSAKERKGVLAHLKFEPGSDLFSLDTYTLRDAIIYNNKNILVEYLKHQESHQIELLSLVGLILKHARALLSVKYTKRKAEELGLTYGYYKRLLSEPWIPQEHLQSIIKITANIDLQLKSGLLEMPKNRQIDYLLARLCK